MAVNAQVKELMAEMLSQLLLPTCANSNNPPAPQSNIPSSVSSNNQPQSGKTDHPPSSKSDQIRKRRQTRASKERLVFTADSRFLSKKKNAVFEANLLCELILNQFLERDFSLYLTTCPNAKADIAPDAVDWSDISKQMQDQHQIHWDPKECRSVWQMLAYKNSTDDVEYDSDREQFHLSEKFAESIEKELTQTEDIQSLLFEKYNGNALSTAGKKRRKKLWWDVKNGEVFTERRIHFDANFSCGDTFLTPRKKKAKVAAPSNNVNPTSSRLQSKTTVAAPSRVAKNYHQSHADFQTKRNSNNVKMVATNMKSNVPLATTTTGTPSTVKEKGNTVTTERPVNSSSTFSTSVTVIADATTCTSTVPTTTTTNSPVVISATDAPCTTNATSDLNSRIKQVREPKNLLCFVQEYFQQHFPIKAQRKRKPKQSPVGSDPDGSISILESDREYFSRLQLHFNQLPYQIRNKLLMAAEQEKERYKKDLLMLQQDGSDINQPKK